MKSINNWNDLREFGINFLAMSLIKPALRVPVHVPRSHALIRSEAGRY